MHVLFIHPNFPAQFGLLAHYLAAHVGWPCTFLTSIDTTHLQQLPFTHINYRLKDSEPQPKVFQNPGTVVAMFDHLAAIYRGLRGLPELQPDLVVGHMSYGTMLYLRDLYNCPFVGYFEMLPKQFWGDGLVLRKEFPPPTEVRLANATYHTMTHLHLAACDAYYTPSQVQAQMCPQEWRHKMHVLPEGVDCQVFQPRPRPTMLGDRPIDAGTRVVTYVSRSLESVRGFDIFMRLAKRIGERCKDVLFVVVGSPRTQYGHESFHLGQKSFKDWVLEQDSYDLDRFVFLEQIPMMDLAAVYNLSNLHVHLSVPWVPSPSLLQAMASGCTILGSATSPVEEFIEHGAQGSLAGFDDVEALTEQAVNLLQDRDEAKRLGEGAHQRALERYDLTLSLNRMVEFFQRFAKPMSAADMAFASLGR